MCMSLGIDTRREADSNISGRSSRTIDKDFNEGNGVNNLWIPSGPSDQAARLANTRRRFTTWEAQPGAIISSHLRRIPSRMILWSSSEAKLGRSSLPSRRALAMGPNADMCALIEVREECSISLPTTRSGDLESNNVFRFDALARRPSRGGGFSAPPERTEIASVSNVVSVEMNEGYAWVQDK